MKHFIVTAEVNVNIQNEKLINQYIILHMQEIVAHNL